VAFHLAAKGSVPQSIEMPARYHEVNVGGTLAVLEACRRHGVRRVVYSASSSAYGDQPGQPKVEHMVPDPCSPYAYSKLACEYLMRTWARCYGVETVSLRYFNIFGPRQRHDSPYAAVVPIFAERIRAGEAPVVYGDGTQSRDFTHVANAVHANGTAAGPSPLPTPPNHANTFPPSPLTRPDTAADITGGAATGATTTTSTTPDPEVEPSAITGESSTPTPESASITGAGRGDTPTAPTFPTTSASSTTPATTDSGRPARANEPAAPGSLAAESRPPATTGK
jgi:nucleoside-diphosphate-sugar epimerase